MPTFKITDPTTGKTLRITGDSPPTEQELEEIFKTVGIKAPSQPEERVGGLFGIGQTIPKAEFEVGGRTAVGDIFERPGAATRAAIREKPIRALVGPAAGLLAQKSERVQRASILPQAEETFQEQFGREFRKRAIEKAGKRQGFLSPERIPGSILAGAESVREGITGEVLGLGADIATNPAGVLLEILTLGLGMTRVGKAVGRFGTKERGIAGRGILRKGLREVRKLKAEPKAPIQQRIGEQIAKNKKLRIEQIAKIKDEATKKTLRVANQIEDDILRLTDDFQRSAETSSLEFQKRIPKAQRAASNEYGKRLDAISDDLAMHGENITKVDMNEVLNNTKSQLRELQLPQGRAEGVIDNLIETKYNTTQFSNSFELREVLNDAKLIKGQASSGVKLGTKPFSDDELGIAIFNNEFGKLLEAKVPAMKQLNKAYAPVIRINKAAHKIFKPRAGELQTKAGTEFVKQATKKTIVKGKISPKPSLERGQRQLLEILEEGTEFGPGVGKLTEPTRRISERLAGREVGKIKAKEVISKASKIKQQRLGAEFDNQIATLERRDQNVARLLRIKDKKAKIRRMVIGGVVTIGIVLESLRRISKFGGK